MEPTKTFELITRKISGHTTPEEDKELQRLIENDEQVRAQYEEIRSMFSEEELEDQFTEFDSKLQWKSLDELKAEHHHKKRTGMLRYAAIFAGLAIAASGFYLYHFSNSSPDDALLARADSAKGIALQVAGGPVVDLSQMKDSLVTQHGVLRYRNHGLSYDAPASGAGGKASSLNKLSVPAGLDYQLTLSDGTEVWINSQTDFEFPFVFDGDHREVAVKGEAYFKIAQDEKRPFIVHVRNQERDATIQVLGTSFNTHAYGTDMRVSLTDGAINFKAGGKEVLVKSGTEVYFDGHANELRTSTFDPMERIGWIRGQYYINEKTLTDIVGNLHAWSGTVAVLDNDAIGQKTFSGLYNKRRPLSVFLDNLKETMHIDYYYDRAGVLHFR
jgi:ferric-dicitrate binding protein FerR (iron transport regulator)